jgi:hypothetical protein
MIAPSRTVGPRTRYPRSRSKADQAVERASGAMTARSASVTTISLPTLANSWASPSAERVGSDSTRAGTDAGRDSHHVAESRRFPIGRSETPSTTSRCSDLVVRASSSAACLPRRTAQIVTTRSRQSALLSPGRCRRRAPRRASTSGDHAPEARVGRRPTSPKPTTQWTRLLGHQLRKPLAEVSRVGSR